MAQLVTANGVALIAILGVSIVLCATWLAIRVRRARQISAVRQLLSLAQIEGRYAVSEHASRLAHDLNNLILVLSLESERLASDERRTGLIDEHIETLREVVADGRALAERCREQAEPAAQEGPVLLEKELSRVVAWLNDGGFVRLDMAMPRPLTTTLTCAGHDIHMLVLALVRTALPDTGRARLTLTISAHSDDLTADDDFDGKGICLSLDTHHTLRADDPRIVSLASIVRRLRGDYVLKENGQGRFRLAVSLPVTDD